MVDDVVELEQRYLLQVYQKPDFVLDHGEGMYVYDTAGRRYLDMVAGIAVNALGYADPQVTATLAEQAGKLIHTSGLYRSRPVVELARALVESCDAVQRAFLCNSGAEAIEGALKFARRHARARFGDGKHTFIAFTGSFHGRTMGAVAITSREKYRAPFEPVMPGVRFAEFNNVAALEQVFGDDVCAAVVEPVQGEGGLAVATPEFMLRLRELCTRHNALLILDEIQCGLGRTGTLWAHEPYPEPVRPDILCAAKPLGGGVPIGAVLLRQEVADSIHVGDHGTTFGGNPLACQVALVVFKRLSDPAFLAHVRAVAGYLDEALQDFQQRHPRVLELRGRGLMRGLRIDGAAADVRAAGHAQGVLVATAGDDVIRLVPPLILERQHVDEALASLDRAFRNALR